MGYSTARATRVVGQVFALLGLLAVPLATAGDATEDEGADRWTPALSMKFHAVQGTAISPDGGQVAYVLRKPLMDGKKSEYLGHIWVAAADGSSNRQFTRGEKSASSPAFSPDGHWLAFTSSRGPGKDGSDAKNEVWLLPMAGGEAEQATATRTGVGSYRWSPDGSRLAFIMRDPETDEEKKASKEKRDVILVDQNFKYGHLYVVRVDPGQEETPHAVRLTAGDFHVTQFDWSPDGTQIVFSHQPDPRINTGFMVGDLSIVTVLGTDALLIHEKTAADRDAAQDDDKDSDDDSSDNQEGNDASTASADAEEPGTSDDEAVGEVTSLVTWAGAERSPRWSPDGRWITFSATGQSPEPIGLGDLYVVAAAGGQPRMLVETPNRRVNIVRWAADSRSIYLSEAMGTTSHIIAVPLEGDKIRQVSSGDGVLRAVSMTSGTDRMAFTWQTTDDPWNVFVSSTRKYSPRRITDLHAGIEMPEMGRTELLSWQAPDGTPVEGLLTYPVEYEKGESYPLILTVHGGPAGVFSRSFTGGPSIYMLQTFAQEGFAVLRPNPRGSTGYGKEFRYANFKDWGFGDLSDLLSGVDLVIERGVADPDRLFLMGWSYGGYMTSFAVTQTDRFKAASMGAGLPNLVSMVTTTDIGDYLVGHMGGEFWEDYATYEKHSAIYHIKNVVTPTQVIHGQRDLRVPFTQGQEFYRSLLRLGVPTEMIVYPRTPHGPREPKFLMDVTDRILKWFDRHMPETR